MQFLLFCSIKMDNISKKHKKSTNFYFLKMNKRKNIDILEKACYNKHN